MTDGEPVFLPEIIVGGKKLTSARGSLGTGEGKTPGDSLSTNLNDDGSNTKTRKSGPKPAAANPAPPIGLRDSHKGKVVAVTPDVKFVGARGQNPTPFITRAYTNDKPEHYSPDVRFEGDRAMRFNSDCRRPTGVSPGTVAA